MPPRTRPAEGDAGHERPERTADGPRGGFGRERLETPSPRAGERDPRRGRGSSTKPSRTATGRASGACTSTYHRQPDERYLGLAILGLLESELQDDIAALVMSGPLDRGTHKMDQRAHSNRNLRFRLARLSVGP